MEIKDPYTLRGKHVFEQPPSPLPPSPATHTHTVRAPALWQGKASTRLEKHTKIEQ